MSISYSEHSTLTCPSCHKPFEAELWVLIDAAERPELAQQVQDGSLNAVACPHCTYQRTADVPLLLHDPAHRRVYFAAPSSVEEHIWRDQAHELLYRLIESLPEEARLPYVSDVQVENDIEGVQRAMLRTQRRKATTKQQTTTTVAPPTATPPTPIDATPTSLETVSPILEAVRELMAADDTEIFQTIVEQHSVLLSDRADATLVQLAEIAYNEGERDVAEALHDARKTLANLRTTTIEPPSSIPETSSDNGVSPPPSDQLADEAYQSLMNVMSSKTLMEVVRNYPTLLEPWTDDALVTRVETALEEGNERLAGDIEERRELLYELRIKLSTEDTVLQAIQVLLKAENDDTLIQVLTDYPILLTDKAQDMLLRLSGEARAQGDDTLATHAVECRAMLRKVRTGLEQ